MKDIVKLDAPTTTIVAGHSMLIRVSMGTLTIRGIDTQGCLHDMMILAMDMSGLCCHLLSGGTAALKGGITIIANEPYLYVGQFKIPLRKYEGFPKIVRSCVVRFRLDK